MIQNYINQISYPKTWKETRVCSVFTSGDSANVENYRPISVTNNFSKVFKTFRANYISSALKSEVNQYQNMFMQSRSITTNSLIMNQLAAEALEEGFHLDVIYLDMSKDFDTHNQAILLHKLKRLK